MTTLLQLLPTKRMSPSGVSPFAFHLIGFVLVKVDLTKVQNRLVLPVDVDPVAESFCYPTIAHQGVEHAGSRDSGSDSVAELVSCCLNSSYATLARIWDGRIVIWINE
ncbi:hypothetical protein EJB05_52460, partial [Eragrostis curvula]